MISSTEISISSERRRGEGKIFWQDVSGLILLAAASLGIGLLVNGLRHSPLPLKYSPPQSRLAAAIARMPVNPSANRSSVTAPSQWQKIGLDEFQEFVTMHRGTIIDARPTAFYRAGHVPGALSLPRDEFETGYAAVHRSLEPAKDKVMAVYCSGVDCKDSELVADALSRLGYQHLSVYQEGWEEWSRAGLPQEVSNTP